MRSSKPFTQIFQDKVCGEILPSVSGLNETILQIDETFDITKIRSMKTNGETWYIANDVCKYLGIKNTTLAIAKVCDDWKMILPHEKRTVRLINDKAFYKLTLRCNKPMCEKFQDIICGEILPTFIEKESKDEIIIEEEESETFNIVKFIEENPISRLSTSYQNKLINKIKRAFSTEEQQIFLASFYCYLNYKKEDFVVDLDDIWEWMGFKRKDYAKDLLQKNFKPDIEFKILLLLQPEQKKHGGNNNEQVLMTVKTFKKMCLLAGTKKSREIHEYYINLEEIIHETVDEETSELRQLLENKDREIEEHKVLLISKETELQQKEIDKIIEMAKMLADNFDLKHIMYLGYIGIINGKHTYKFGYTDNIKERMKVHINDYGKFELIYCIECRENRKLEKKFKKNKTVKAKQFSHVFTIKNKRNDGTKKKKKVELFCLDDDFTLEDAKKILQRYKKFLDAKYDENLEQKITNQENGIVIIDEDNEDDDRETVIESPIIIGPPEPLYEDENKRKLLNQCLPSFLTEFTYQQKNREAPRGMRWCNSFCQKYQPRTDFLTHLKFLLNRCKSCVRCENSALDKLKRGILTTEQISNNPTIVMLPDNTKECTTCHKVKALDKFPEKRNACRECRNKVRSKYKDFNKIIDEHVTRLSKMKTRKEIETLLDTYVNDNFKLIVSKLELGRKFNDNKQMLKTKVLDYFIERNHILS